MTDRNCNGRLRFDTLGMNVYFDDLLEEAKNVEEVKFLVKSILEALDSAIYDTLADDDINPTGEELCVDDVLMELRGY